MITELKTLIVLAVSSLISLFSPIKDVLIAMLILFCVNGAFGLLADIFNGRGWDTKKALSFLLQIFIFFGAISTVFAVGKFLHEEDETMTCVKIICIITTWVFSVNIFRNCRVCTPNGSSMHRLFDILYYVASVQVVEKIPFVKEYLMSKKGEEKNECK